MPAEHDAALLPALWFARVRCRPVVLRAIGSDDAAALADFVKALSPLSRLRRFHVALSELPPSWLRTLTRPDPAADLALLALAPGDDGRPQVVAEARYVAGDGGEPGEREFALAVADAWQGQGLGFELLRRLIDHAARHGVRRLVGDVLRDNLPLLRLAGRAGFGVRPHPTEARLVRVSQALLGATPDDVGTITRLPPAALSRAARGTSLLRAAADQTGFN